MKVTLINSLRNKEGIVLRSLGERFVLVRDELARG
jgi:hypothetical protein